jgi:electron transfer flavoprotein beta subunit
MKIAVCLKRVPSTTADLRPTPDGTALNLAGVEHVVNPYDEYALEAALRIRDARPGSTILAFTAGDDSAAQCATYAFSLGADQAVHVKAAGLSAQTAARAAAVVVKEWGAELVLCGRQAIDDDQWEFTGALAEALDWPHVGAVTGLIFAADNSSAECKRRFNRDEQTLTTSLPAVISCDRGLNEPRSATLKGRLDAKKKQAVAKTLADLGIAPPPAALKLEQYAPPPQKAPGKTIALPPAQAAAELVRLLRQEAKVL